MNPTNKPKKGRKMFWVMCGLGVIVGLLGVVMIVGSLLPENYESRVQLSIDRTPEQVWDALLDYKNNPQAGPMAKKIEPLPDENGLPVWTEDLGSSTITVRTASATKPSHMVRRLADSVVPMTAEVEIRIEAAGQGSRITAVNQTSIKSGTWHVPIFRVIMTLTGGGKSSIKTFYTKLAERLGATARFE